MAVCPKCKSNNIERFTPHGLACSDCGYDGRSSEFGVPSDTRTPSPSSDPEGGARGVQTSIATKQESCPESATRTETAAAIYSALSEAYVEHSALSVSGFNLFGDSKSIKAAQKWLHSHNQIDDLKTNLRHWRDECGKLHAQLTKTPSADHDDGNLRGLAEPNRQPHAVSQGWRDIETAPMDGSRVLLFTDELTPPTIQAQWRPYETFFAGAGEWVDVWNNDPIETNKGPIRPTHWMPLPAPPSPAKTGGAE